MIMIEWSFTVPLWVKVSIWDTPQCHEIEDRDICAGCLKMTAQLWSVWHLRRQSNTSAVIFTEPAQMSPRFDCIKEWRHCDPPSALNQLHDTWTAPYPRANIFSNLRFQANFSINYVQLALIEFGTAQSKLIFLFPLCTRWLILLF